MLLEYEMLTGKKIKSYATPGAPGKTLGANNGETIMEAEYRKIVGKLLWSTKKDSPDCANAVRELSSYLSCPGEEQWDGISRVVGSLSSKLDRVIKIRKPSASRTLLPRASAFLSLELGLPPGSPWISAVVLLETEPDCLRWRNLNE